jgi:hypothetical protein
MYFIKSHIAGRIQHYKLCSTGEVTCLDSPVMCSVTQVMKQQPWNS